MEFHAAVLAGSGVLFLAFCRTRISTNVSAANLRQRARRAEPIGTSRAQRAGLHGADRGGWYYFSFARLDYNRKDYEATIKWLEKIGLPYFYWTHLLDAAAKGQLGSPDAGKALSRILEIKPNFSAQLELRKWNTSPRDLDHIMEGLRKAGWKG